MKEEKQGKSSIIDENIVLLPCIAVVCRSMKLQSNLFFTKEAQEMWCKVLENPVHLKEVYKKIKHEKQESRERERNQEEEEHHRHMEGKKSKKKKRSVSHDSDAELDKVLAEKCQTF